MVSGNNTSLFTASGAGAKLLQGIPQESDLAVHQPRVLLSIHAGSWETGFQSTQDALAEAVGSKQ